MRRRLLALALEVLTGAEDQGAPAVVTVVRGRVKAEHTFTPQEIALFLALRDLSPMHAGIVQALQQAGRDLPSRAIAAKAGYKFNSRFRAAITELCARGVLVETVIGYGLVAGIRPE